MKVQRQMKVLHVMTNLVMKVYRQIRPFIIYTFCHFHESGLVDELKFCTICNFHNGCYI
jgi:hypothetical protein